MFSTSIEAFQWALSSGHLERHMAETWSALSTWNGPPPTGKELNRAMLARSQYTKDGYWKDLSDLEQKGAAVKDQIRPCMVTGRKAYTWRAVQPPWIPPPPKPKKPTPDEFRLGMDGLLESMKIAEANGFIADESTYKMMEWLLSMTE